MLRHRLIRLIFSDVTYSLVVIQSDLYFLCYNIAFNKDHNLHSVVRIEYVYENGNGPFSRLLVFRLASFPFGLFSVEVFCEIFPFKIAKQGNLWCYDNWTELFRNNTGFQCLREWWHHDMATLFALFASPRDGPVIRTVADFYVVDRNTRVSSYLSRCYANVTACSA